MSCWRWNRSLEYGYRCELWIGWHRIGRERRWAIRYKLGRCCVAWYRKRGAHTHCRGSTSGQWNGNFLDRPIREICLLLYEKQANPPSFCCMGVSYFVNICKPAKIFSSKNWNLLYGAEKRPKSDKKGKKSTFMYHACTTTRYRYVQCPKFEVWQFWALVYSWVESFSYQTPLRSYSHFSNRNDCRWIVGGDMIFRHQNFQWQYIWIGSDRPFFVAIVFLLFLLLLIRPVCCWCFFLFCFLRKVGWNHHDFFFCLNRSGVITDRACRCLE